MIRALWYSGIALIIAALALASRGHEALSFWMIVGAAGMIGFALACEARR